MSKHAAPARSRVLWILGYLLLAVAVIVMAVWFAMSPKPEPSSMQYSIVPKPEVAVTESVLADLGSELVTVPRAEVEELSFALSELLYESASAVIVASPDSLPDATAAAEIPLPVLVLPAEPGDAELAALDAEMDRLGATGWIALGVNLPEESPELGEPVAGDVPARTVLVNGDPEIVNQLLAALEWTTIEFDGDPRASAETIDALASAPESPSVVVGEIDEDFEWQLATALTGVLLPTGTQIAGPDALYVALYGHPVSAALGVLGEQGVEATIRRAEDHAAPYRSLVDVPVVPTLEIIATVASAGAGDDDSYSRKSPISELEPLIDAAGEAGMYVVLDLQPGRTDFLTQAKLYEEFLMRPYVGLALDPEWRLKPDQVHLRQIGQVDIDEVNEVVNWLSDLTRENSLPQKVMILHSFQIRMTPDIDQLDTSRSELAIVMHVDGQGSQGAKQETWRALHAYAPNIEMWGWKNFYDEDEPEMLTPEQTIANVHPQPVFISYQ